MNEEKKLESFSENVLRGFTFAAKYAEIAETTNIPLVGPALAAQ